MLQIQISGLWDLKDESNIPIHRNFRDIMPLNQRNVYKLSLAADVNKYGRSYIVNMHRKHFANNFEQLYFKNNFFS